jgi:hypothetical protein
MDLEREIASLHGVEKVEADRKLRAESRVDGLTQE